MMTCHAVGVMRWTVLAAGALVALSTFDAEAFAKSSTKKGPPGRVGLSVLMDVEMKTGAIARPSLPFTVGIDWSPPGKLVRYHLLVGFHSGFGNDMTICPLTMGFRMPFWGRSDEFRLEAEILLHGLRLDIPLASVNGSGISEFSSGVSARLIAVFSNDFFISVTPFALQFRFLTLGGGGVRTDVGIDYPIQLTAGFQY